MFFSPAVKAFLPVSLTGLCKQYHGVMTVVLNLLYNNLTINLWKILELTFLNRRKICIKGAERKFHFWDDFNSDENKVIKNIANFEFYEARIKSDPYKNHAKNFFRTQLFFSFSRRFKYATFFLLKTLKENSLNLPREDKQDM